MPAFARLRLPETAGGTVVFDDKAAEGRRWTTAFILSAFIPALTYYPAFALGGTFLPASGFLPQGITNQILAWAVVNAVITLALMRWAPKRASRRGIILPSIAIAVVTAAVGYAALWLCDAAFKIDFRFWIVALKLMNAEILPDFVAAPMASNWTRLNLVRGGLSLAGWLASLKALTLLG